MFSATGSLFFLILTLSLGQAYVSKENLVADSLPSIASIRINLVKHVCAGVFLHDNQTIVTSGSCMRQYSKLSTKSLYNSLIVSLHLPEFPGHSRGKLEYTRLNLVTKVISYGNYTGVFGRETDPDIALVKLRYPLVKAGVRNIVIPETDANSDSVIGGECYLALWNKTDFGKNDKCVMQQPPELHPVKIERLTKCQKYFPDMAKSQFCVTLKTKTYLTPRIAKEDVGSPLFCSQDGRRNFQLAGILNFGEFLLPCGHVKMPTYFDSVPDKANWILNNM